MEDMREFDSPLISSAKPNITPEPVVSKITGLDDSGSFIRTIVTTLATDPAFRSVVVTFLDVSPEEREAMRRSIRFWLGYLTGVERGKVVKGYKDDLDDGEVADVAMVARETLSRDETYQTFKCLMSANPLPAVKRRGRNGHRFDLSDQRTVPRRRANRSRKSRRPDRR